MGNEDYPDASDMNECMHEHWSPFPLGQDGVEEQDNINNLLCDFGAVHDSDKHKAFPDDYEGLHDTRRPETCNRCHLTRCHNCHVDY